MLGKLTQLAESCANGWKRAEQWIDANLSGDDRQYARDFIQRRQSAPEQQIAEPEPAPEPAVEEPGDDYARSGS
jgi:hypothetical protein